MDASETARENVIENTSINADCTNYIENALNSDNNELAKEINNTLLDASEEIFSTNDTNVEDRTNKDEKLSNLVTMSISCAINEALEQIIVISKINKLPESTEAVESSSMENNVDIVQNTRASENLENNNMLIKLARDIEYLQNVLSELLADFKNGSFTSLLASNTEYENNINKEDVSLETARKIHFSFRNLENSLKTEKVQAMIHYKHQTEVIGKLKDECEDLLHNNDIKFNYIDKWQSAREWQNEYRVLKSDGKLAKSKSEHENKIIRELRIHEEIFSFYQEVLHDNEMMLCYWQTKYKEDLQEKEDQLKSICERKDDQATRLSNLSKLYLEREAEINAYNKMKQERREAEEQRMVLAEAATTIQAWWRGLMFRRKLGQYRLRKSKGKDKKGNKGKN